MGILIKRSALIGREQGSHSKGKLLVDSYHSTMMLCVFLFSGPWTASAVEVIIFCFRKQQVVTGCTGMGEYKAEALLSALLADVTYVPES